MLSLLYHYHLHKLKSDHWRSFFFHPSNHTPAALLPDNMDILPVTSLHITDDVSVKEVEDSKHKTPRPTPLPSRRVSLINMEHQTVPCQQRLTSVWYTRFQCKCTEFTYHRDVQMRNGIDITAHS